MKRSALNKGRPSPALTALGFGSAPLGNLYTAISYDTAEAAVDAAWAAGIRFFDTAPQYGFGLAEERLGRALGKRPRGDFVLSTKVGRILEDCDPRDVPRINFVDTPSRTFRYDYSYDGILRSFEASLGRLGVDFVDILLVHDVDAFTHGSREASDKRVRELFEWGGYRALDELKRAGRVGSIGAGVNEWEVCQTLLDRGDFDGFLLAGRYTLLEQTSLDSFLPRCEARDVGIIAGGPFNSGILATGPVPGATFNYGPAPTPILERTRALQAACERHGVPLAAAALQFVAAHPCVTCVLAGAHTRAQVEANEALLARPIPHALWADLKRAGLLHPDAPVPGDISLPRERVDADAAV
jgi:D-threo-aldose 1-dehydrogenase